MDAKTDCCKNKKPEQEVFRKAVEVRRVEILQREGFRRLQKLACEDGLVHPHPHVAGNRFRALLEERLIASFRCT